MLTVLYIFLSFIWWIIAWLAASKILIKSRASEEIWELIRISLFFAPIALPFSIIYYFFFRKEPPPIDGYNWWDLVEHNGRQAIVVSDNYIIYVWEWKVFYAYSEDYSPILSGEMKDELLYLREAQDLERKGKEFISQAEKVRKASVRVQNVLHTKK